jgi:serine/threonine protein kinase
MGERIIFDHYRLCQHEDGSPWELGRGGMGVTYKAMDINLHFLVALKVINSAVFEDEVYRKRFVKEARAAALLRHRNIASVHHLGSDDTHYFYAMEFIDGITAQALVARHRPMPLPAALRAARQVAQALGAAARRQLVHRDIKPANLMILADPEEEWQEDPMVKVIDFGLVRSASRGMESTALTLNGFVGTPHYASPEQIEERELDARSDIYSLGCTLWFLLTGRPPFTGTMLNIFSQHLHDEPRWKDLRAFPSSARKLLACMLRKDPAERPQTPRELREAIDRCLENLRQGSAAPLTPLAPPAPPSTSAKPRTQALRQDLRQKPEPLAPPAAPPPILAKPQAATFQGFRMIALAAAAVAAAGVVLTLPWKQPGVMSTDEAHKRPPAEVVHLAAAFEGTAPSTPPLPQAEAAALEEVPPPIAPEAAAPETNLMAGRMEDSNAALAVNDPFKDEEKPVLEPSELPSAPQKPDDAEMAQEPERSAERTEDALADSPVRPPASPAGAKEATPASSPSPAAQKRPQPAAKRSRPAKTNNRRGAARRQRDFNPLRTISEFFRRNF